MFSWQAVFSLHVASHGGGESELLGSTRESRFVQLCEKTSHAVSSGRSTFAENPVLLLLIVSAHFSASVSLDAIRHISEKRTLQTQVWVLQNNLFSADFLMLFLGMFYFKSPGSKKDLSLNPRANQEVFCVTHACPPCVYMGPATIP